MSGALLDQLHFLQKHFVIVQDLELSDASMILFQSVDEY
jgi:hypothetical protein